MKISRVEVERFRIPARTPPFVWRAGLPGSEPEVEGGLLRISTDEGVEGLAQARRGVILEDLVNRRLRDELIGEDPLRREWLWHRIWELDRIEEFPIYILGLVDIALHDLAGKALGVPVYEMLGGFRTEIPAYASTVTFPSTEEYLDVADQCLELGYVAVKLHAWGDARRDAELATGTSRPTLATASTSCTTGPPVSTSRTPSTWAGLLPTPVTAGTRSRCGSSTSPRTSGYPSEWTSRSSSPRPPMGPT